MFVPFQSVPTSRFDLIQAPTHAFFYDLYHNFDTFRDDFDAKYNKTPYVSPMLRWRWSAPDSRTGFHSKLTEVEGKLLKP